MEKGAGKRATATATMMDINNKAVVCYTVSWQLLCLGTQDK